MPSIQILLAVAYRKILRKSHVINEPLAGRKIETVLYPPFSTGDNSIVSVRFNKLLPYAFRANQNQGKVRIKVITC